MVVLYSSEGTSTAVEVMTLIPCCMMHKKQTSRGMKSRKTLWASGTPAVTWVDLDTRASSYVNCYNCKETVTSDTYLFCDLNGKYEEMLYYLYARSSSGGECHLNKVHWYNFQNNVNGHPDTSLQYYDRVRRCLAERNTRLCTCVENRV